MQFRILDRKGVPQGEMGLEDTVVVALSERVLLRLADGSDPDLP